MQKELLRFVIFFTIMAGVGVGTAHAQSGTHPENETAPPRIWLDAEGNPLPFQTDEEILDFLSSAKILSTKILKSGITKPLKVLLEKDGLQMHAIFHDVDIYKLVARLQGGRTEIGFRDIWRFQIAAYRLARLLGLNQVAPTVRRRVRGNTGSLTAWVENAMTERRRIIRKIAPPDMSQWNRQMAILHLFDELIANTDRHHNNILIDPNWRIWLIDHTRAFRRNSNLAHPHLVETCERGLWKKLKALDRKALDREMKGLLRKDEVAAILKRRDKLIVRLEGLIREKGEEEILYTLEMPSRSESPPSQVW